MPRMILDRLPEEVTKFTFSHINETRYVCAARMVGGTILDAACGIGAGTKILYRHGHDAVGIDANPEFINIAARYFSGPAFIHGMIEDKPWELEYGPNPFNCVVSIETFEHVADPTALCSALWDALHPEGGVLVATTPNANAYPLERHRATNPDPSDLNYHHAHYTTNEVEKIMHDVGFEVKAWFGQRGRLFIDEDGNHAKECNLAMLPGVSDDTLFMMWIAQKCA